ncbi:hypothetical protein [Actinomadura sp. 9N407]|uniref:hypothetical protein n=1 Tax=Actinomadura sp. 9N407 TaxID=3375154 RepID=UPI0037AE8232
MQLPRVVIAAVFFVIGALIAVPSLVNWMSSPSSASPAGNNTTTSPSPSPSPKPTSPKPTTPSATPPKTPPTSKTPAPALPLRVTIGTVGCPEREVKVTVRNTGTQNADYAIEKNDDTEAVPGQIGAGATRTSTVTLREDRRTRIEVTYRNQRVEAKTLTANCAKSKDAAPAPTDSPDDELPRTGPDTVLWARAATGGAAMITGLIIFWYGGIWPRRREQVFAKKRTD